MRLPGYSLGAADVTGLTSTQLVWGTSAGLIGQESALAWSTTNKSLTVTGTVTKVSAAGSTWDAFNIPASTMTLTGGVTVTEMSLGRFVAPTITSAVATTVSDAATLTVTGAPAAGGSVTLSRGYAFWAKAGAARFDGGLVGIGGTSIAAAQLEVVTATDTTNGAPSTFDSKFFMVGTAGGATGSGVAMSYRTSTNTGYIFCITPGTSYRTLNVQNSGANACTLTLGGTGTTIGFFGGSGTTKATVSGSKGANAALASLMTALSGYGIVTDSTS